MISTAKQYTMVPRLLIADRDARVREECRRYLRACGYAVNVAADGLQCLASLQESPPDVMVLDPEIPWGGGSGVLECLRDDFSGLAVTVLLANGGNREQISQPLRGMVTACVLRPHGCKDLSGYVTRLEAEIGWTPECVDRRDRLAVERCYR